MTTDVHVQVQVRQLPANFDDLMVHHEGNGLISVSFLDAECHSQKLCEVQLVLSQQSS